MVFINVCAWLIAGVRFVWLVVGLVSCQSFRVHDKWVCQRIVNAAHKRWCDVVSDACQIHAAHSSQRCVLSCIVCVLVFGFWVRASKCDSLRTVPFWVGPMGLFLTWINDLHAANKVSEFDNSLKFHFELVLGKSFLTWIKDHDVCLNICMCVSVYKSRFMLM